MDSVEMVTVRMSRGDLSTPWGFEIVPPGIVTKIVGGSLADRAGLQNGDHIDEFQGEAYQNYDRALHILKSATHEIDLVVLRDPAYAGTSTRLWKPQINVENGNHGNMSSSQIQTNTQSHNLSTVESHSTHLSPSSQYPAQSVKVSLEHTPISQTPVPGFNVSAKPYHPLEVNNNTPAAPAKRFTAPYANRAEQYLFEKGGLFGTDPAVMKAREPRWMNSEALKLIQEEEQNRRQSLDVTAPTNGITNRSASPAAGTVPGCFTCGKGIVGVMCRANNLLMHPECFTCSTCGSSLRNVGHHFYNEKFYCDVHGQQWKHQPNAKVPSPRPNKTLNPDLAVKTPPTAVHPVRVQEPPRGFYQPDVLAPGPLSPPQPPKRPPVETFARTSVYNNQSYRPEPKPVNNGYHHQANQERSQYSYSSQQQRTVPPPIPPPPANNNLYADGIRQHGQLLNQTNSVPYCEQCKRQIRGAYVLATGMTWCPEHFTCSNPACNRRLLDTGFVEEKGKKYCEKCFETLIAPICNKCGMPITADCLTALQKQWHPECFSCHHCSNPFGNSAFYLENGRPYCERDWNALFTTKCISCKFPIEAGDRWVEAIGSAFHSNCFTCTVCQTSLEGQSFYAKNGLPYCRIHA